MGNSLFFRLRSNALISEFGVAAGGDILSQGATIETRSEILQESPIKNVFDV